MKSLLHHSVCKGTENFQNLQTFRALFSLLLKNILFSLCKRKKSATTFAGSGTLSNHCVNYTVLAYLSVRMQPTRGMVWSMCSAMMCQLPYLTGMGPHSALSMLRPASAFRVLSSFQSALPHGERLYIIYKSLLQ